MHGVSNQLFTGTGNNITDVADPVAPPAAAPPAANDSEPSQSD